MKEDVARRLREEAIEHIARSLRAGDLAEAMLGMNSAAHTLDEDVAWGARTPPLEHETARGQ